MADRQAAASLIEWRGEDLPTVRAGSVLPVAAVAERVVAGEPSGVFRARVGRGSGPGRNRAGRPGTRSTGRAAVFAPDDDGAVALRVRRRDHVDEKARQGNT